MKRLGLMAYGAGVIGLVALLGRETVNAVSGLHQYIGDFPPQAIVGWVLATVGPVSLSIAAWGIAQRVGPPWLLHLAFILIATFVFKAGSAMALRAVDAIDSPLFGMPLVLGATLLALSLLVHGLAIIALTAMKIRSMASGS